MNTEAIVQMTGLPGSSYFDMPADSVEETFRIFVKCPVAPATGRTYPVIYVLDGNLAFTLVSAINASMNLSGELPEAIIVGIGYTHDSWAEIGPRRMRDMTPTVAVDPVTKAAVPADASTGGAQLFLKFITDKLKPWIEANYPADADDAALCGASLGGLFGSWALLSRSGVFNRYVLVSPSLWWNGEEIWELERQCAAGGDDLAAKVFVTAGGLETVENQRTQMVAMAEADNPASEQIREMIKVHDQHGWVRMAEITPEFVQKLLARNYGSLEICCHNLPDETHLSVSPAAISRGLRYVFGSWAP